MREIEVAVQGQINLWLHLMAFAIYTGATAAIVLIVLPLARREDDQRRRERIIAGALRIYDPLSIAALGVLVMTGAFNLTGYKAALRGQFFDRVGGFLIWKLAISFLVINLAAYIAFGIGHRIVRGLSDGATIDPARLEGMLVRLNTSCIVVLALVALVVWIALGMTRSALAGVL